MRALVTLTPAESKELIARAVAGLPVVRAALEQGVIVVGVGTTNGRVAARLLGEEPDPSRFAAGIVHRGVLCVTPRSERLPNLVLRRGRREEIPPLEALELPEEPKVLIKGANAVDPTGLAGVLAAARDGGTAGRLFHYFQVNGWPVVAPVGLEKLVPSVRQATEALGRDRLEVSWGARVGMIPLVGAQVVTEVQALELLAGVSAVPVASGGVGGTEGAVTLVLEGERARVERALEVLAQVKGTVLPAPVTGPCSACHHACDFAGRREAELPAYLREHPGRRREESGRPVG